MLVSYGSWAGMEGGWYNAQYAHCLTKRVQRRNVTWTAKQ